jgi:hypothetical protein
MISQGIAMCASGGRRTIVALSHGRRARVVVCAIVLAIAAAAAAGPAYAAWPGTNGKIVFVTYRGSADTIWTINADGSNPTFVFRSGRQYTRNVELSPNGTRIVFNNGNVFGGNCVDSFGCPIQVVDLADGHAVGGYSPSTTCAEDHHCSVAAATWIDNDHLVFAQSDSTTSSSTELELDLTSGVTAPYVGVLPTDLGRTALSPDAHKKVQLAPGPDGSNQVFVANADGSGQTMVTAFTAPGSCPETECPYDPQEVVWQSLPADATAPVVTAHVSGTQGTNGWYTSDVTVSWTMNDPESGVASTSGCATTTITADTPGTTLTCAATNGAGTSSSASTTVKRDATRPVVTFTGNAGTYTVADQVALHCTASDALSGIATSSCHDVNAPAYTFGPGTTTISASATDRAGNTTNASVTFVVSVTPASLCLLTSRLVHGSAAYTNLSAAHRIRLDVLVAVGCQAINGPVPRNPVAKAARRLVYHVTLKVLSQQQALTPSQVALLEDFAASL